MANLAPAPPPASPHLRAAPEAAASPRGGGAGPFAASVVVPTLDEAKTLAAVLRPLRAAAGPLGLEVVVSDGGSTDGTVALALGLADRVVCHRGPERQTIAAGRNAGARAATADVLLFLNADVAFPPDAERFLADLVAAAREAGAATCRVTVHPDRATLADRAVLGTCNALFWAWNQLGRGMGRGECHAVRRDVFEAVGGYREHLAAGEDFDLFERIARAGRGRGGPRIRFLWGHVLYEDPRRYRARGYARTMADWFRNSLYVTFLGRSYSTHWEAVR